MHGEITGLIHNLSEHLSEILSKIRKIFSVRKKRVIYFSPKLYVGNGIDPESMDKLKSRLQRKPLLTSLCLILLSENQSDQLDIISSRELAQTYYENNAIYVAGMARTKVEAISLIIKMTEDCLADRRDCSLKEFLAWQ